MTTEAEQDFVSLHQLAQPVSTIANLVVLAATTKAKSGVRLRDTRTVARQDS